jgi:hypothetical protein
MFRLRVKDARRHPQFHPIVNSHCALVNHLTSVEPNRYKVYFEDLGTFLDMGLLEVPQIRLVLVSRKLGPIEETALEITWWYRLAACSNSNFG